MLITITDILTPGQLAETRAISSTITWIDGAKTAGSRAARVKQNEQADLQSGAGRLLHDQLLQTIRSHPLLIAASRPKTFSRLLLSRTGPGGGYGAHIDNALMGRGSARMRADLSLTCFLSDPEDYDGGELEIDLPGMVHSLKPPAGSLVLYPTSAIHRVAPVTRGSRLACVGWIQSLIPDAAKRALLLDLTNLGAALQGQLDADSPEILTLDKSISNLLRMWVEL